MRVVLDPQRCQGHNRCYLVAPELFEPDDFGYALLKLEGPVPTHLQEQALLAVANCPEFAIRVEETPGG